MKERNIGFITLIKIGLFLFLPTLLILGALLYDGRIEIDEFIYLGGATVILYLAVAWPIFHNIRDLSRCILEIAVDHKVVIPRLFLFEFIGKIATNLGELRDSWEEKRHRMESVITEREILVDALPELLIMTNDDGKILRTNKSARGVFGQNLAGRSLMEIIPDRKFKKQFKNAARDIASREVKVSIDAPISKDFLVIMERFPIPSIGGITVIITLSDITELQRLEKMRVDFVANASHEIRTPLTSIRGFVETMREQDVEKSDREEFLRIIHDQAERMEMLISDLLSLSKIEMNLDKLPKDRVDLLPIISKQIDSLRSLAEARGMIFREDFPKGLPTIRGDSNELSQVFYNLISNAIKYGNADSKIELKVGVTEDLPNNKILNNFEKAIYFSVKDQGVGVASGDISRLTERFFRVDKARSREAGGTGLGLAIVRYIIQRHKAALIIKSELGKGSEFSVYFPLKI